MASSSRWLCWDSYPAINNAHRRTFPGHLSTVVNKPFFLFNHASGSQRDQQRVRLLEYLPRNHQHAEHRPEVVQGPRGTSLPLTRASYGSHAGDASIRPHDGDDTERLPCAATDDDSDHRHGRVASSVHALCVPNDWFAKRSECHAAGRATGDVRAFIVAAGNYERVVLIHLPSSLLVTSNPPVKSMANVGESFRVAPG
jgi:hypothetical protein